MLLGLGSFTKLLLWPIFKENLQKASYLLLRVNFVPGYDVINFHV
jgi:hypothetical protein